MTIFFIVLSAILAPATGSMIDAFLLTLQSWHFFYKAAARILDQLIQCSIALREKAFDILSFEEMAK